MRMLVTLIFIKAVWHTRWSNKTLNLVSNIDLQLHVKAIADMNKTIARGFALWRIFCYTVAYSCCLEIV